MPFLRSMPRGDGHPVYLLPGFMADSQSTAMLRRWLDNLGYNAIPWGFGRNLGPRGILMERLIVTVGDLAREHGQPRFAHRPKPRRRICARNREGDSGAGPSGDHARLTVQADGYEWHRTGGDASVRDGDRRESRRPEAQHGRHFTSGSGAVDRDLQPHRRHRSLEDLHRRRNAVHRQRRGVRQPLRHGIQPGDLLRDRRSSRAAAPTSGGSSSAAACAASSIPTQSMPRVAANGVRSLSLRRAARQLPSWLRSVSTALRIPDSNF